jgi:hypothetical protein
LSEPTKARWQPRSSGSTKLHNGGDAVGDAPPQPRPPTGRPAVARRSAVSAKASHLAPHQLSASTAPTAGDDPYARLGLVDDVRHHLEHPSLEIA